MENEGKYVVLTYNKSLTDMIYTLYWNVDKMSVQTLIRFNLFIMVLDYEIPVYFPAFILIQICFICSSLIPKIFLKIFYL